jgi:hypothetical protein
MKKGYVIGGLAVLGAIALIAWYKKPKKNSEGFFGANGSTGKMAMGRGCAYCKNLDSGDIYHTGSDRSCNKGDICLNKYA